ncbi:hypothetical protein M0805_008317 [Coniferiporia weirii]|nr:hypothetical protein M0805_008317 [Coniferiporia weirii]
MMSSKLFTGLRIWMKSRAPGHGTDLSTYKLPLYQCRLLFQSRSLPIATQHDSSLRRRVPGLLQSGVEGDSAGALYSSHWSQMTPGSEGRNKDANRAKSTHSTRGPDKGRALDKRAEVRTVEMERTGTRFGSAPYTQRPKFPTKAEMGILEASTSVVGDYAVSTYTTTVEPFLGASAFRKSSLANLPAYSYAARPGTPATVVYIKDHVTANEELEQLLVHGDNGMRIAGFDLEWRPTFVSGGPDNPVAVVQISMGQKILLLQVKAMEKFPHKLASFLNDKNIIKAGVNISGDAQRLYRDYSVSMHSCLELSYLARCVDRSRWPGPARDFIGLARLVHAYENCSVSKGKTQMSNWENELTKKQQEYAANDAHAAMVLCTGLLKRARNIDRSLYTFNMLHGAPVCPDGSPWKFPDLPDVSSPPTDAAALTASIDVKATRPAAAQARVAEEARLLPPQSASRLGW